MNDAIVKSTSQDIMALGWTKGQVEAIANTVAKGATLHELYTFLYINKAYGLDPFKRESYFMKDPKSGRWAIIVGIDGMRKIARRDPNYLGVQAYAVREGDTFEIDAANYTVVHKFGSQRGKILGAWARADAKGRLPVVVWVDFDEYFRPGWDAWTRMPATMIAKVAESHALRRQFGLGDLYTEEEMGVRIPQTSGDAESVIVTAQAGEVVAEEADFFVEETDAQPAMAEAEVPAAGVPQAPPAAAEPASQQVPASEEKASLSALSYLQGLFRRKCPGKDITEFIKEQAGVTSLKDLSRTVCSDLIKKLQGLPDPKQGAARQNQVAASRDKQAAQPASGLEPGAEALFKLLTAGQVREFKDGQRYFTVQVSAVQPAVSGTFELYCPVDRVSMLERAQPNMYIAVTIAKVNGNKVLAGAAMITEAA